MATPRPRRPGPARPPRRRPRTPPEPPPIRATIIDPIYDADLLLLVGPPDWADALLRRRFPGADLDPFTPFHFGRSIRIENATPGEEAETYVLWLHHRPEDPRGFGNLAHEVAHVTFFLLDDRGLAHTHASDEAFAYHQEWLMRTVLERIVTAGTRERTPTPTGKGRASTPPPTPKKKTPTPS